MIAYTLIRSKRKTLSIELNAAGALIVRAPMWTTKREIDAFILSHESWIERAKKRVEKRNELTGSVEKLTESELRELAKKAAKYIPERVAYYAPLIGVTYGRITIRCQKTRWGSCSAKGNLNFNCLLMLTPPEVIDSVVVHELCHRKEMNHSQAFYREIYQVMPEYKKYHKWLKDHGTEIMGRVK